MSLAPARSVPRGRAHAHLGTITEIAANFREDSGSTPQETGRLARAERYELQAVARWLLPDHRVRGCLLHRQPGAPGGFVEVRRSHSSGLAYYGGVLVCGRGAVCPCCGSRIAEHRCREVQTALDFWKGSGGVPALITFTMPHYRSQRLSDNVTALLGAYRDLTGDGSYRRLCRSTGAAHTFRSLEFTWGQRNGWHPHLHVLGFFGSGYGASGFPEELTRLWFSQLHRQGVQMRDAAAVLERGISFQLGFSAGAKYLTKLGRSWGLAEEVTQGNRKRGRSGNFSPADLLRFVRDDNLPQAAGLFQEYAAVVHGLHLMQWSRGARAALGLAGEEVSDVEIAGEVDAADPVLASLTPWQWRAVRHGGWRSRLRLVELADHDEDAARAYVADCVARYEIALDGTGWAAAE